MKSPKRIQPLIEEGLVDEVICQLMSDKKAMIYMVRCGSEVRRKGFRATLLQN